MIDIKEVNEFAFSSSGGDSQGEFEEKKASPEIGYRMEYSSKANGIKDSIDEQSESSDQEDGKGKESIATRSSRGWIREYYRTQSIKCKSTRIGI